MTTTSSGCFSHLVRRHSASIVKYLNVQEILPYSLTPGLDFLKSKEEKKILQVCDREGPRMLATRVLAYLTHRKDPERKENDFRKFVACINLAVDHKGHRDLTKMISRKVIDKLGEDEWKKIQNLEKESETPVPSPYSSPCRSPDLIVLQGTIAEEWFVKLERDLWISFSRGHYEDLNVLIDSISTEYPDFDDDCHVVVLWFRSLIKMHRDKDYCKAISILDDAMEIAHDCVNSTILVGRIRQRKAQVYLMDKKKKMGVKEFERAKYELQFVGRGYDKTNLFCREAKVLSATQPNCRERIEEVYDKALSTLSRADPYFLASYPSITLSKAAFHLHFSFGSKPEKSELFFSSATDIQKAKDTLRDFVESEHIFIEMRRMEYDLILAELLRLEGKKEDACKKYLELAHSSSGNISSIAKHRIVWIKKS